MRKEELRKNVIEMKNCGLLQCTGTGVIAGNVTDASSSDGIHGATISNDFVSTISVNGEYIMISPCGSWKLTVVADGYDDMTTTWDVKVYGGDVNWNNISMNRSS